MSTQKNIGQHIDKNIIFLFLSVFFISSTVLGYKYYKHIPCKEVLFTINADRYQEGSLIKFADNTSGAEIWEWDFGDSTTVSTQKEPFHIYKKSGEYTIRLLVNSICEKEEIIAIKEREFLIDSTKLPIFKIPKSIKVGEVLSVKDETPNASKWEWRFGETANVNSKSRYAKYEYKEPGLKTISLIVNGDLKHITRKRINVLPTKEDQQRITPIESDSKGFNWNIKYKPSGEGVDKAEGNAKPKTVPFISEAEFTRRLLLVSDNKMSPKSFSEFFCGDINKPMVANSKNTSFLVFCQKIKDRKIKIKSVNIFRDKGSNCIKTLTVDYKRTGIF